MNRDRPPQVAKRCEPQSALRHQQTAIKTQMQQTVIKMNEVFPLYPHLPVGANPTIGGAGLHGAVKALLHWPAMFIQSTITAGCPGQGAWSWRKPLIART
jgi:hypothetical protein